MEMKLEEGEGWIATPEEKFEKHNWLKYLLRTQNSATLMGICHIF